MRATGSLVPRLSLLLVLAGLPTPTRAQQCEWSALGSGMNNSVRALTVFDDGSGLALYAGGTFTVAGGVDSARIAKWDGAQWSPLGWGLNGSVRP